MATLSVKPYGAWKSSITADLIVGETVGLGQVSCDGSEIYWTELNVRLTTDGPCCAAAMAMDPSSI